MNTLELSLLGGISILLAIYLGRLIWLWGYTQGEMDEYRRQTERMPSEEVKTGEDQL